MFTSKGLFSEILCPYKDTCMLPNCFFLHPEPSATDTKVAPVARQKDSDGSNARSSEDGQRERRDKEVDSASSSVKTTSTALPDGSSPLNKPLLSVRRDVSLPPLRRAADCDSTPSVKKEPAVVGLAGKTPAQTLMRPLKVESLNPRMLKSSPASHDLRYKLLKALHDQLVRVNTELRKDANPSEEALVLSDQALITMALDMEEMAAMDKPSIYSNVVKNKILEYKRMSFKDWKEKRAKDFAQEKALKAMKTPIPAASEPPRPIETGLTAEEELAFLPRVYTPIAGLAKHGYVSTAPTEEEISQARKGIQAAKGWEICDRCKARFQVFPGRREEDGALASGGSCMYHWGKPFLQDKLANDPKAKRERIFRCCGQAIGDSLGCTRGDSHVFKVSEVKSLAALLNFKETPENNEASAMPVCIDGEMGYTVHGLELIRLTATAWPGGEELLDVLVRPIGEVLDLNSRFSGVWPQQMADAAPWSPGINDPSTSPNPGQNGTAKRKLRIVRSPAEARSLLFRHLSPQTPLIGHGLENDLNAVRLIHPIIIDTALLFPHKAGLPYRNSLKALMLTHLGRHIQVVTEGKIDGHDSKEDARAAGDLVRWKIGWEWQKMKKDGWSIENGQFIPPAGASPPSGVPCGPKSMLTVDFLEREPTEEGGNQITNSGSNENAAKSGTKRRLAEISGDDDDVEGEVEGT